MSDVVAFLNARLDEDEQVARAATEAAGADWHIGFSPDPGTDDELVYHLGEGARTHLYRHDPARVLCEVKAKRGAVRELNLARKSIAGRGLNVPFFITWTLWHLAAAYSDHPDYRQEWEI